MPHLRRPRRGYVYDHSNYARAENTEGTTVDWLKYTAEQHKVHIAGTFLRRAPDGLYNTMLLVAPNGQTWQYDKSYPWMWERAYFKPRQNPIQVAETRFGRIGMLICWDVAHAHLWAEYAGKVDLMLVSSCPPLAHQIEYHLPDGRTLNSNALGSLLKSAYVNAEKTFGELLRQQARWLGVPSVNTTGAGKFETHLPRPNISITPFFAARPDLWKYIKQAEQIKISAGYFDETFIANAHGEVLNKTKIDGDDFTVATVEISDTTPQPQTKQPRFGLPRFTYLGDRFANMLMKKFYDQHWRMR
jgi:predicted amidohydrolase